MSNIFLRFNRIAFATTQALTFFLSACANVNDSQYDSALLRARQVAVSFLTEQGFTEYKAKVTIETINFDEVECILICNDPLNPAKGVSESGLRDLLAIRKNSIGTQPRGYQVVERSGAVGLDTKKKDWIIYFDALRSDTGEKLGLFRCIMIKNDSIPVLLPEFCDSKDMRQF